MSRTFESSSPANSYQLQCCVCTTLQHPQCYGFIAPDDPRRTVKQVCYRCLLDPGERRVLAELQEVALQRRAMHLILRDGATTDSTLAPYLGQ